MPSPCRHRRRGIGAAPPRRRRRAAAPDRGGVSARRRGAAARGATALRCRSSRYLFVQKFCQAQRDAKAGIEQATSRLKYLNTSLIRRPAREAGTSIPESLLHKQGALQWRRRELEGTRTKMGNSAYDTGDNAASRTTTQQPKPLSWLGPKKRERQRGHQYVTTRWIYIYGRAFFRFEGQMLSRN